MVGRYYVTGIEHCYNLERVVWVSSRRISLFLNIRNSDFQPVFAEPGCKYLHIETHGGNNFNSPRVERVDIPPEMAGFATPPGPPTTSLGNSLVRRHKGFMLFVVCC